MDNYALSEDMNLVRKPRSTIVSTAAWSLACLLFIGPARAADINGAWVSDRSACNTVFVKKNGVTSISESSEAQGSGFIIDQGRLKAKLIDCAIKTRREEGPVVHLIAACATDVALSDVQFNLRVDSEDQVTRLFPGIPEMQISYFRCQL
jgi:hypothetical protein